MIDPPPIPAVIAGGATGAGVRVAIIDSGVNFDHPHLAIPGEGAAIVWSGAELEILEGSFADRYGHGTCCAALIHALAPDAKLIAVRVMDDRPSTDAVRLGKAMFWALDRAEVLCVPLGTRTRDPGVTAAVRAAAERGAWVVAPRPGPDVLPGAAPEAIGVEAQDGVDVARRGEILVADGRARGPGGSNFRGASLAAARVAAAVARWIEASGPNARTDDRALRFKNDVPVI